MWVPTAAFSPDGAELLTASEDGTCKLWSAATGECWRTLDASGGRGAFAPHGADLSTLAGAGAG
eukprot:13395656-Alexandrium_andersonii.AAC.1